MATNTKYLPINKPEYAGMQRRLANYIRGKEVNTITEFDGVKRRPHNPCTEGYLPGELHYLSVTRRGDLL